MPVFHAYVAGFSNDFTSLDALRTWANGLLAKHKWLSGQELKIWSGVRAGDVDFYHTAAPARVIVM